MVILKSAAFFSHLRSDLWCPAETSQIRAFTWRCGSAVRKASVRNGSPRTTSSWAKPVQGYYPTFSWPVGQAPWGPEACGLNGPVPRLVSLWKNVVWLLQWWLANVWQIAVFFDVAFLCIVLSPENQIEINVSHHDFCVNSWPHHVFKETFPTDWCTGASHWDWRATSTPCLRIGPTWEFGTLGNQE